MEIKIHQIKGGRVAELIANDLLINTAEDALQLLGDLFFEDTDKIILWVKNISPAFFDLKTGLAGEILQKYSNYRVRLAIVGDLSGYTSKSLRDFIWESNKGHQICFVASLEEALSNLSN